MRNLLRYLPVYLIALIVATAIAQAEDQQELYEFEFDGDSGPVNILLDSDTMGFSLHDLAVGERRTALTGAGNAVTLTRLENEIVLDVGGQRFELPAMPGMHDGMPGPGHGMGMLGRVDDDALVIVSGKPLDRARQETIRAALSAAGITETVKFHISGSGEGRHRVVIRKEIEH